MSKELGLDEKCQTFITAHLQVPRVADQRQSVRAVTISRQTGSGAHIVADRLAEILCHADRKNARPWTVFDRNLVQKVLEDHNLPARLAQFMREDRMSEITDTMDELFGLHPPSWALVHDTSDTILRLAQLGNVILIGRGAAVITSRLQHVFHVRLVGSLDRRVERWQEMWKLTRKEALNQIEAEDRGRARYLKKYFKKDVEDPLLYHLVINTDLVDVEDAAHLIAEAMASQYRATRGAKA